MRTFCTTRNQGEDLQRIGRMMVPRKRGLPKTFPRTTENIRKSLFTHLGSAKSPVEGYMGKGIVKGEVGIRLDQSSCTCK